MNKRMRITLIVLLVALSGCRPDVRSTVLHMGDSLMQQSADAIQFQEIIIDEGFLPVMNAIGGSSLNDNDYWIPRLESIKTKITIDAVVVSLGTNDARYPEFPTEAELDEQIAAFLTAIGPVPVFWIIPHDNIGVGDPTVLSRVETFRNAISDAASSGLWDLTVVNFNEWADNRLLGFEELEEGQEWPFTDFADLLSDGVHFTDVGETEFALMIVAQLNQRFPASPDPEEDD